MGYFAKPLNPASRILFLTAGLLLFFPASGIDYGIWTDVAGVCLVALLVAMGLLKKPVLEP